MKFTKADCVGVIACAVVEFVAKFVLMLPSGVIGPSPLPIVPVTVTVGSGISDSVIIKVLASEVVIGVNISVSFTELDVAIIVTAVFVGKGVGVDCCVEFKSIVPRSELILKCVDWDII